MRAKNWYEIVLEGKYLIYASVDIQSTKILFVPPKHEIIFVALLICTIQSLFQLCAFFNEFCTLLHGFLLFIALPTITRTMVVAISHSDELITKRKQTRFRVIINSMCNNRDKSNIVFCNI